MLYGIAFSVCLAVVSASRDTTRWTALEKLALHVAEPS